jgi:serine phosphatase RsbU (regulator of sigma subunit)
MPQISIRSAAGHGNGNTQRIPIGGRTTIGRAEDSDIRLPDRSLSRRHAEILQRRDGCYLVDLGSTNGTYLNGARVPQESALHDGDVITVGEVTLVYHAGGGQPPAVTPLPPQHDDWHEPTRLTNPDRIDPHAERSIPLTDIVHRATRRHTIPQAQPQLPDGRVLHILTQASAALLSHHPLPELFERILDLLLAAIPAERAAVMLLEGEPATPVIKARRTREGAGALERISDGIARRVIDGHMALLLPDVMEDNLLRRRASILSGAIRCAMCVPLWVASSEGEPNRVLGLVYLDSRARRPGFTETDLEILTVLANVAAAKIETARLLEESLEKRRLEADMQLAADIQMRVLPRVAPTVPGFDISATTRPCRTVGGDYYDLCLDGEQLHLALGDVSGKGLGAAMLMIALRAAVRAHWTEGRLADATTRINATFHENVPDDKYATFFMGRLDTTTGVLTYVNAGHNRPLLVRADGRCETLGTGGTVLGAFETASYEEDTVVIHPGDTLLVFSDGVSETWPDADVADQAMCDLLRDGRALDAAAVQRTIFDTVEHIASARPLDDRTLLILKRH